MDKDKYDSSIEFVQNKKIDLEKLTIQKKIFTSNISVTVETFLEAQRKFEEIQNSKDLFHDDEDNDKEEKKNLKFSPELNE